MSTLLLVGWRACCSLQSCKNSTSVLLQTLKIWGVGTFLQRVAFQIFTKYSSHDYCLDSVSKRVTWLFHYWKKILLITVSGHSPEKKFEIRNNTILFIKRRSCILMWCLCRNVSPQNVSEDQFLFSISSWHFAHSKAIQIALPGWLCLRFLLCYIRQCPLESESALRLRDVSVAPMRLVRHALASGQPGPASHNSPHTPGTVQRQPSQSQSLSISHLLITRLLVPQSTPVECEHQD